MEGLQGGCVDRPPAETGNRIGRRAGRFRHAESEMLEEYSRGCHLQAVWSVGDRPWLQT